MLNKHTNIIIKIVYLTEKLESFVSLKTVGKMILFQLENCRIVFSVINEFRFE